MIDDREYRHGYDDAIFDVTTDVDAAIAIAERFTYSCPTHQRLEYQLRIQALRWTRTIIEAARLRRELLRELGE